VQRDPFQRVSAPAIGLLIAGIVNGLAALFWLVSMVVLGGLFWGSEGGGDALIGIAVWFPIGVVRLALDGLTIYGALKMRKLQNWNLSLAAAISASLPCTFVCFLTMPLGIWAIVVLFQTEVKQAFAAQRQG
jgi:hypothetical protein